MNGLSFPSYEPMIPVGGVLFELKRMIEPEQPVGNVVLEPVTDVDAEQLTVPDE
jgi:hypothetical protein